MDFGYGGGNGNGSSDDHEEISNSHKGKKSYHRHTTEQIQQLESFFKECPHPDDNQRRQLSRELGLEPKQIKFWFQNKRTQAKAQSERADNSALRRENERIHCENLAICEALKHVTCPTCDGPHFGEEERQRNLQQLRIENAFLKQEHERLSTIVANVTGKPVTNIQSLSPALGNSLDIPTENSLSQRIGFPFPFPDPESILRNSKNTTFPYQLNRVQEMEKSLMIETVASAMDELVELLRVNEPIWINSSIDGRIVLHRDSYNKIFPKANHFNNSSSRIESSKDSCVVAMPGQQLVEMFLDSSKWVDFFPTIVTKASTIEVLQTGNLGGSLHLMFEQMHILSPLVAPREFFFLRYCQQLDSDTWVVVDVSYDCSREIQDTLSHCTWKLPSGCLIQNTPSGKTQVTWVEHVEVDDKSLTHRLYRDVVCGCQAYGAKRWIASLQRMCERFSYSMGLRVTQPTHELEEVIDVPEGRKNIMKLSQRMVKDFCAILSMSDKLDFHHLSELNNSGVRVSVRKSNESGQPQGMIVTAATSFWIPFSCEILFNFFRDEKTRFQWDMLSNENPMNEIAHISCGTNPSNCISIIQPFVPHENNMLVLQESCIDPLGALVIYAPIELQSITAAISGSDTSKIPILPSGFIICGDGHPTNKGSTIGASKSTSSSSSRRCGSLVTLAFQVLVYSQSKQINMESVSTINTLISSTVQKIKVALDCSEDLD